jgi:hypothetical protein
MHVQILRRTLSLYNLVIELALNLFVFLFEPFNRRLRVDDFSVQFLWQGFSYAIF